MNSATFELLGDRYDADGDQVIAFGFYLIASSMSANAQVRLVEMLGNVAYRMDDLELAVRCFVLASAHHPGEGPKRTLTAIKNIVGLLGVKVASAEIKTSEMNLKPIVEELPVGASNKQKLCLVLFVLRHETSCSNVLYW